MLAQFGRTLVIVGASLVLVGLFLTFGARLPFQFGRLPLDFHIKRDTLEFYFPLGTSIVVSIVLTLVFSLLKRR